MAKKKAKREWRPARSNPSYTTFEVRVLMSDADLIQDAAEAQASRLSIQLSRNNFCSRAIVAAAIKELGRIGA